MKRDIKEIAKDLKNGGTVKINHKIIAELQKELTAKEYKNLCIIKGMAFIER